MGPNPLTPISKSRLRKLIVDIPDDLHKKLKIEAINKNTTLRNIVIKRLKQH